MQPDPAEVVGNIMADREPVGYEGNIPGVEGDEAFELKPPIVNYHDDGIVETIVAAQRDSQEGMVIPLGRVLTTPDTITTFWSVGNHWDDSTSTVVGGVNQGIIFEEKNPTRAYYGFQQDTRIPPRESARNLASLRSDARKMVLSHLGVEVAAEATEGKPPRKRMLGRIRIRRPSPVVEETVQSSSGASVSTEASMAEA